jgi:hypothetical protein
MDDGPDPSEHHVNEAKPSYEGELEEKIRSTDRLIEIALETQRVLSEKAKVAEGCLRGGNLADECQNVATFLSEHLKSYAELISLLRNRKDKLALQLANAEPTRRTDGLAGRGLDAPSIGNG